MEFSENVSLSMVRFLRPHETTGLIHNGHPTSQDTRGSSSDPSTHSFIGHQGTRPTANSPSFLSTSCMETLSNGGSVRLLAHSSFESLNRTVSKYRSTKRVPAKRPQALNLDKVSIGHFSCFSGNLSDIGDDTCTKFSVLFGPGHFICVCQKVMQKTADTPEVRTQISRNSCLNKSPSKSPGSPKSIFRRVRSFWSHKKKLVQSTEDLYSTPSAIPISSNMRWNGSRSTHPPLHQSKKASPFSSTGEPPSVYTGSNSSICSVPSKSDGIYRDIRKNAVVTSGVTTCDQRHTVSIAAQQAVDTIENELNSLNWGQTQCDALNAVLLELTKLLPCRQFATEFIRKGGHEVLFHLVETFDCSDQLPTTTDADRQLDNPPEFDVWSNLVACLVELAEYSINSSEIDTDLEQTEAGDDRSSNYSRRISIDSQSSYGDSKDATLIRSASDTNMNELFSWHLASKKFLSVLVCRCRAETRLETLRNTLKLLLSVLVNCPPGAESVISQTGPEFILSQLKKVHTIPTTDRSFLSSNPGTTPNLTRRWGSRGESPGMLSVSPHPSTPPSWSRGDKPCDCRSVPGCINNPLLCELVSTLCDIIYVILYRSRQSGCLSDALPTYLSNRHLNELITCCAPFSGNDIPVYTPRKFTGPNELTGKNALVKRASDSGLNVNGSTSYTDLPPVRRHGSTASGQSIFFFPDPADPSFRNWTFSKQFRSQATCSSRACQAEQNALNSLYRLHHVLLVWLADLMNTPVNRESVVWSDKMKRFCALALGGDSIYSTIVTEDKESIYTLLGFKHPEDPFLDFESPPGLLGLSCLCILLQECDLMKGDILSYGRVILRNVAPALSPVPFSYKTGVKMHATRRSVPDRTESVQSSVLCRRRRSTVDPHVPSLTIDEITPTNHLSDIHRPLFPLVEAANALVNMLCELLGVHDNLYPLYSRCQQHSRPPLFPILFRPRRHLMPFEELFICTFSVFFYSWAQMQATPDDLPVVLSVLREQLKQTVLKNPNSLDAFEQHLTRCTPETVRAVWKELEEQNRSRMLSSHPALRELKMDLIKQHELNVREQRINALTNRAPLDYIPAKGTRQQQGRENQKFEVTLSPDHKSLIVHDTKQESSELWPIGCIDRVVTGLEEKVKKNAALTLVVYMRFRDMPDTSQVHLVARSQLDYKYWLDGFHILLRRGPKSDQFDSDIQQLVDLDMKIRLSGLDLQQLPRKPRPIPPDPPEFDFDENCL